MNGMMNKYQEGMSQVAIPDGFATMTIDDILKRRKFLEDVRASILVENVDYMPFGMKTVKDSSGNERKIPAQALLQSGAQQLQIAFRLSSEIAHESIKEDLDTLYSIQVPDWQYDPIKKKDVKVFKTVEMRGKYEVISICTIYDCYGRPLARCAGSCTSLESKFQNQPYNDVKNNVLKRADKRAYVAAIIAATASSGLFAQDTDEDDSPQNAQGQQKAEPQKADGWMSDKQRGLFFVKAQQKGIEKEVSEWAYKYLNRLGIKDAKRFFDAVIQDTKDAETFWKWAKDESKPKDPINQPEPAVNQDPGEPK